MANEINDNAHSTNPRATIITDIRPTPIGDNASLFNLSNPITTAKFRQKNESKQKIPTKNESNDSSSTNSNSTNRSTPENIIDSSTQKPPTKQQLRIKQKKLRKKLQQKLLPQEDEYIKNMTSLKLITEITKQRITTDKIWWLKTLEDKEHDRQVDKKWEVHIDDNIYVPEEEQQMIDRVDDAQRQE